MASLLALVTDEVDGVRHQGLVLRRSLPVKPKFVRRLTRPRDCGEVPFGGELRIPGRAGAKTKVEVVLSLEGDAAVVIIDAEIDVVHRRIDAGQKASSDTGAGSLRVDSINLMGAPDYDSGPDRPMRSATRVSSP